MRLVIIKASFKIIQHFATATKILKKYNQKKIYISLNLNPKKRSFIKKSGSNSNIKSPVFPSVQELTSISLEPYSKNILKKEAFFCLVFKIVNQLIDNQHNQRHLFNEPHTGRHEDG